MPDRSLIYGVDIDLQAARRAAGRLETIIESELRDISAGALSTGGRRPTGGGGGGGFGVGGVGPNVRGGFGALAGFTVGGYALQEIVQSTAQFAEFGVEVRRTSVAFETMSGSAELAAAKLIAVQNASGGAVSNMEAMNIANRAAALGMANTASELERVTRFATISGRVLGLDTAEALDNMALAASNLSFARLDQLGINSSKVRDRFQELNTTMEDSKAFLQAMLEVGEETFSELNNDALTAASGIEKVTAAVENAKAAIAGSEFGATLDLFISNFAKNKFGVGTTEDRTNALIDLLNDMQRAQEESPVGYFIGGTLQNIMGAGPEQYIEGLQKAIPLMYAMDSAVQANVAGAAAYREELNQVATAMLMGIASDEQIARLGSIEEWFSIVVGSVGNLESALLDADSAAGQLVSTLTEAQITGNLERLISAKFQFAMAGATPQQQIGLLQQQQGKYTQADPEFYQIAAQLESLNQRIASDAQREWQRAADESERAWKAAAQEAENAFKNALQKVPGLFGTSEVTEDQMKMAEAGIGQRFADSFLREFEDQVINGIDRGINVEEVARQAGIDPALPQDIIATIFRNMWESGELWANPENITRFIDMDAVQASLDKGQRESTGQSNLMAAMAERFGDQFDFTSIGNKISEGFEDVFSGDGAVDVATPVVQGINSQFTSEESLKLFQGAGNTAAQYAYQGWEEGIRDNPFAMALALWVKESIIAEFKQFFDPEA